MVRAAAEGVVWEGADDTPAEDRAAGYAEGRSEQGDQDRFPSDHASGLASGHANGSQQAQLSGSFVHR